MGFNSAFKGLKLFKKKPWERAFKQFQLPRPQCVNVLCIQKAASQIRMAEWSQSFTLTKNVSRGFILCFTSPTQWKVWQPQKMKMSSQGVMSSKKASNSPGQCPVKEKKICKYSFCLMVEASDHAYVWPQTYTWHMYSFTYRLYFMPANPCDTYKSAVRHTHDPMLVP